MCSQWLTEVPQDFEKDWLMVPCPVGKRRRVVAQNVSPWGGIVILKCKSLGGGIVIPKCMSFGGGGA